MDTPFDIGAKFIIKVASTPKQARRLLGRGYVPVECSFGADSVVCDEFVMDHHGPYHQLESVAIRAYRDHFGARAQDPRFVVTGFPDEDATFAIAALAGIVPHPSLADAFPAAPPRMRKNARQNVEHVAKLISVVDVDPDRALELADTHFGRLVLSWRLQAHPTCRDLLAWYGGVDRWRNLLTAQDDQYIVAAGDVQEERLEEVLGARSKQIGDLVAVVDFSTFGPNSAYYKQWLKEFPVIVAHIGGPEGLGPCSFVVRDLATARKLYGEDGLMSVYPQLEPAGCGGREIIGGSSRVQRVNWKQAIHFGEQLCALAAA